MIYFIICPICRCGFSSNIQSLPSTRGWWPLYLYLLFYSGRPYIVFIHVVFCWAGNSLFRSKSLSLKSNRKRIALVALQKRATRAIYSWSLFYKERRERFARFLRANRTFALSLSKNEQLAWKQICCFNHVFGSFLIAPVSLLSLKKEGREQFAHICSP